MAPPYIGQCQLAGIAKPEVIPSAGQSGLAKPREHTTTTGIPETKTGLTN
jgi:hypothetical protein